MQGSTFSTITAKLRKIVFTNAVDKRAARYGANASVNECVLSQASVTEMQLVSTVQDFENSAGSLERART